MSQVSKRKRRSERCGVGLGRRVMAVACGVLLGSVCVGNGDAAERGPAGERPKASELNCRKVVLGGSVEASKGFDAAIGEGWVFRLVPIAGGGPGVVPGYTGWDIVVDRERGGGYPDAVLLATPPYGSLSEREVGTTFGLRAQDAVGWNPRHFHFLTSAAELQRGRACFREAVEGGAQKDPNRAHAAAETLLQMAGGTSAGEFRILDARLSLGSADGAGFAQQWATRLRDLPHTVVQSGGGGSPRGEVKWIRFSTTLWLPRQWKVPANLGSERARCTQ